MVPPRVVVRDGVGGRRLARSFSWSAATERLVNAIFIVIISELFKLSPQVDGATVWMAAHWPIPPVIPGSRRTATRVTLLAISLSSSSHFALRPYSNEMKPVALPPGRAKLSTKPAPTGSGTCANTIGTPRIDCSKGPTIALPVAMMTSGVNAANSATYLRALSALPAVHRASIRTLLPSTQPNCCKPRRNAVMRACPSASSPVISTTIRRTRSPCCARAASGHPAAAPPSNVKEFAAPHSITSSARASSDGGTERPSALAVLRLITSSYLVGACTGRSPGFSPLRTRST